MSFGIFIFHLQRFCSLETLSTKITYKKFIKIKNKFRLKVINQYLNSWEYFYDFQYPGKRERITWTWKLFFIIFLFDSNKVMWQKCQKEGCQLGRATTAFSLISEAPPSLPLGKLKNVSGPKDNVLIVNGATA